MRTGLHETTDDGIRDDGGHGSSKARDREGQGRHGRTTVTAAPSLLDAIESDTAALEPPAMPVPTSAVTTAGPEAPSETVRRIHGLVLAHGHQAARRLARTPLERRLVDVATRLVAEDDPGIGITYSGFCLTALPHKRLPDSDSWHRRGTKVALTIDPGTLLIAGQPQRFGVPYGSRARLILIYLQSMALRHDSPEVELGNSMKAWLERMDVPVGGKSYKLVAEQANRLSACHLTFFWLDSEGHGFEKEPLIKGGGIQFQSGDGRQGSLWRETVRLSDQFFQALKEHPVALNETALRIISNRSLSLDIYIWLAYRLHHLDRRTTIRWPALFDQFGAGFQAGAMRKFKQTFREALAYALAVYPDARVEAGEDGLSLQPSRPPVAGLRPTQVLLPKGSKRAAIPAA